MDDVGAERAGQQTGAHVTKGLIAFGAKASCRTTRRWVERVCRHQGRRGHDLTEHPIEVVEEAPRVLRRLLA